jgi:hypothetical protein
VTEELPVTSIKKDEIIDLTVKEEVLEEVVDLVKEENERLGIRLGLG